MLSAVTLFMALAVPRAAADCPVAVADLDVRLVRALAAFEEHRYLDFEGERRAAEAGMDCVGGVLRDQALVDVHLVWTARALLDGDEAGLLAGIRALRVVAPGFSLPESWAHSDPGVQTLYQQAESLGPGREVRLPGRLVVDGHVASSFIPSERSAVVQIRNVQGSWSAWYVAPTEPATIWMMAMREREVAPTEAVAPVPVPGG